MLSLVTFQVLLVFLSLSSCVFAQEGVGTNYDCSDPSLCLVYPDASGSAQCPPSGEAPANITKDCKIACDPNDVAKLSCLKTASCEGYGLNNEFGCIIDCSSHLSASLPFGRAGSGLMGSCFDATINLIDTFAAHIDCSDPYSCAQMDLTITQSEGASIAWNEDEIDAIYYNAEIRVSCGDKLSCYAMLLHSYLGLNYVAGQISDRTDDEYYGLVVECDADLSCFLMKYMSFNDGNLLLSCTGNGACSSTNLVSGNLGGITVVCDNNFNRGARNIQSNMDSFDFLLHTLSYRVASVSGVSCDTLQIDTSGSPRILRSPGGGTVNMTCVGGDCLSVGIRCPQFFGSKCILDMSQASEISNDECVDSVESVRNIILFTSDNGLFLGTNFEYMTPNNNTDAIAGVKVECPDAFGRDAGVSEARGDLEGSGSNSLECELSSGANTAVDCEICTYDDIVNIINGKVDGTDIYNFNFEMKTVINQDQVTLESNDVFIELNIVTYYQSYFGELSNDDNTNNAKALSSAFLVSQNPFNPVAPVVASYYLLIDSFVSTINLIDPSGFGAVRLSCQNSQCASGTCADSTIFINVDSFFVLIAIADEARDSDTSSDTNINVQDPGIILVDCEQNNNCGDLNVSTDADIEDIDIAGCNFQNCTGLSYDNPDTNTSCTFEYSSPGTAECVDSNGTAVGTFDIPTLRPTAFPTLAPSVPTIAPSFVPTVEPSNFPSSDPTASPSHQPSADPTDSPTIEPTTDPTDGPTIEPTFEPTSQPTPDPTDGPTFVPTADPTDGPTIDPTFEPTSEPTDEPTKLPTKAPSAEPTAGPTDVPTIEPSDVPTSAPSDDPTERPSDVPTQIPTKSPDQPTAPPSECADGDAIECETSPCGPGEDPNCEEFASYGCVKCKDGYFFKNRNTFCIECASIPNCQSCSNWSGCTTCSSGVERWNKKCGYRRCINLNS